MTQPTGQGPRSAQLHARRLQEVSGGFGLVTPRFIDHAEGGRLIDVDGRSVIDFASGIAVTSVGAANPMVVAAVSEQVAKLTHTCFMVTEYEAYVEVCARLNRLTPGDHHKKSALFTTGAEAVENAVKIARFATGRAGVVVLDHAYHGRTLLTMTMTAKHTPYKKGFGPYASDVYRAPAPYPFRWPGGPEECAEHALAKLKELVLTQVGAENTAAIVVEPIQGEGGFIVPPKGWFAEVSDFAQQHGIVLVADEIQSGLGRTGDLYACEYEGVVPDLITSAKALAGGLPLSAVTGRADLLDAVPGGGLGGTYAGNPVACAAALAALDVIEGEDLAGRARTLESIAREMLTDVGEEVGELRGRGAMLALEFTQPGSMEPDAERVAKVAKACHDQDLLVLTCGTFGNVIRLLPPLVIDEADWREGLGVLVEAVRST